MKYYWHLSFYCITLSKTMLNMFKSCGLYRKVIININFMCKGNCSLFFLGNGYFNDMFVWEIFFQHFKKMFVFVAYFRCFCQIKIDTMYNLIVAYFIQNTGYVYFIWTFVLALCKYPDIITVKGALLHIMLWYESIIAHVCDRAAA